MNCEYELKVTKISSTYLLETFGKNSIGHSESHFSQNDT